MRRPLLALLAAGALAAGAALSPSASAAPTIDPLEYGFQGEGGLLAEDADQRRGAVTPSAAQQAAVRALGARAVWNELGTPRVLTRDDTGYLSAPRAGSPEAAARAFVQDNLALLGLSAEQVTPQALEVEKSVPLLEAPELRAKLAGAGYPDRRAPHVVTLRQVFAGAPTGLDGVVRIGLDPENRVAFVSSTLTADTRVTNRATVSLTDAYRAAAQDAGVELAGLDLEVTDLRTPAGATVLRLEGIAEQQTVRLVTLPTPLDGVRLAHEVVVLRGAPGEEHGEHPYAYISLVDAETGQVLHRRNRLQHADDSAGSPGAASVPYWKVFPNAPDFPQVGVPTPDNRVFWCFAAGPECNRVLGAEDDAAKPYAYDEVPDDLGNATPSFSTRGNNAQTAPSRVSFLTPDVAVAPVSPGRTYDFPFTDQWHSSGCSQTSFVTPGLNDIDAATTNLFVMHNRMHDWSYYLGFTEENSNMQVENVGSEADSEDRENDPEIGNSQAGSIGGGPTFQGRDNANQISLPDGTPGITNQYLWEPLQAGFYAPCTDGAYDMGIVGHEYGHAVSNKMTDGSSGLSGAQAGSMGEAWSDLQAVEYLNGFGLAPYADENPFSLAPYVTGDKIAGIRNYGMNDSPLNFSNIEYDGNGTTSPHADGEIWSATQFDIRQRLIEKYDARFPSKDKALQARCADGLEPSTVCPGNRRWIQLIFDGFLLQPGATSMLDSRDAILAGDKMRYGGANLPELWGAFAKRGMGEDAFTIGTADREPDPGFRNPLSTSNATLRFRAAPVGGAPAPEETNVFVGAYEARVTPLVVMNGGATSDARSFEPGTYALYVQAPGYGHRRLTITVRPGETRVVDLPVRRNLASIANGAEISGDGGNLELIADDTEASNWGSVEGAPRNPAEEQTVRGKQVTVALAGGAQTVREVQVSTANRPALCSGDTAALGCEASREAPYDTGGQSRFAALRSFEILTCDATVGSECAEEGDFVSRLVAKDAFPAGRPRPTAPDLSLRTFALPETKATHVRIKVLDNQCTGNAAFSGEENPEGNEINDPDCVNGFTTVAAVGAPNSVISLSQKKNVRIAELQVFASRTVAAPATGPVPVPVAVPDAAPPQAQAPQGQRLPATGPLPVALPALLLTGIAFALMRGRRRDA